MTERKSRFPTTFDHRKTWQAEVTFQITRISIAFTFLLFSFLNSTQKLHAKPERLSILFPSKNRPVSALDVYWLSGRAAHRTQVSGRAAAGPAAACRSRRTAVAAGRRSWPRKNSSSPAVMERRPGGQRPPRAPSEHGPIVAERLF